ncbi:unnamed protein product [Camellia sinensis]
MEQLMKDQEEDPLLLDTSWGQEVDQGMGEGVVNLPFHPRILPRNALWLFHKDLQATRDYASMSRRCIQELPVILRLVFHCAQELEPFCGQDCTGVAEDFCW